MLGIQFLFAQGVEENAGIRGYLDNMFSTLDKTKVPGGLLRDFAFELVELDKYSGNLLNEENLSSFHLIDSPPNPRRGNYGGWACGCSGRYDSPFGG